MGGQGAGPVRPADNALSDWEKQVEAMVFLLTGFHRREFRVDEFRRHIEALPPPTYDSAGYYGRWILSMTETLIEKGVIDRKSLEERMARKAAD